MASSPWTVVDVCDSNEDDNVQVRGSVPRERKEEEEEEEPDVDDVALRRKGHHHGTVEAELQCIICQYAMFKPVSVVCGHSFCRVCLVTSLGTKPLDEAQCPICRVAILHPISPHASVDAVLSVNVTLWNLVQLLMPSVSTRIHTYGHEEDRTYRHALAKLTTAWNVLMRRHQAAREDREGTDDESVRGADDRPGHTVEYPVLKLDETEEANLHIARTIVLDTSDENEDGHVHMRVGLAIQAFPSVVELYNDEQACVVSVLKMEEDEESVDGMPFVMREDGSDDALVCPSYYNEIQLRVCELQTGICLMQRRRGAISGVVTFPRLWIPGRAGPYAFHFVDTLYGLKLSLTTRVRARHDTLSDTPMTHSVRFIQDEARDATWDDRDADEVHESVDESDESFVVADHSSDEEATEEEDPMGCFSDDEEASDDHDPPDDAHAAREREDSDDRSACSGEDEADRVDGDADDEREEARDETDAGGEGADDVEGETLRRGCGGWSRRRKVNQIVDTDEEDEGDEEGQVWPRWVEDEGSEEVVPVSFMDEDGNVVDTRRPWKRARPKHEREMHED